MFQCEVETGVPIPIDTNTSTPYYTVYQKARAACASVKKLSVDLNTTSTSTPTKTLIKIANKDVLTVVKEHAEGKELDEAMTERALSTPEGAMQVSAFLDAFSMEVVEDAKRLRNYVTNNLILESKNPDPRVRIKALELIGKITDVGLFTERTELTLNNKSTIELETSLKSKIQRLMGGDDVQDAKVTKETKKITLNKELEKL